MLFKRKINLTETAINNRLVELFGLNSEELDNFWNKNITSMAGYVRNQLNIVRTDDMEWAALAEDPDTLKHMKQNPERCRYAVRTKPSLLAIVVDQTPAMCYDAVQAMPDVIASVHDQTDDICLFAISGSKSAFKGIRKPTNEMRKKHIELWG